MLLAEYDYDTDIAVQRKEAFNDGILQGRNEGIAIGEERGITIGREEGRNEGIAIGEERGRNEGISLGITQGAREAKLETAKNALSMKLTLEQIASLTGLSVEVIQDLADK